METAKYLGKLLESDLGRPLSRNATGIVHRAISADVDPEYIGSVLSNAAAATPGSRKLGVFGRSEQYFTLLEQKTQEKRSIPVYIGGKKNSR